MDSLVEGLAEQSKLEARCGEFASAVVGNLQGSYSLLEHFMWTTRREPHPLELFNPRPVKDLRPWFQVEAWNIDVFEYFLRHAFGDENSEPGSADWLAYLKEAVKVRPGWRHGFMLLGRHHFRRSEFGEAVPVFRAAFLLKSDCHYNESLYSEAVRAWVATVGEDSVQLSNIERAFLRDLKGFFCPHPFGNFEVWNTGEVYVCCGHRVPAPVGNIFDQTADEIWNSEAAREIRRSINDGDYKYCSRTCSRITAARGLPTVQELAQGMSSPTPSLDQRIFNGIAELDDITSQPITRMKAGPGLVNIAHDFTCNLACPSCRRDFRAADSAFRAKLDRSRERVFDEILPRALVLKVAGDGDPFASKHYREILASLDVKKTPNLQLHLLTNGVLFTPREWERFSNIVPLLWNLSISIDAATPETYQYVRRGGDWGRLMENLEFLAERHREGAFPEFRILFVVQQRNFREMKSFVEMGVRLGVTGIVFAQLHNGLDSFHLNEYEKSNIYNPRNEEFSEFCELLKDPIFDRPEVILPRP